MYVSFPGKCYVILRSNSCVSYLAFRLIETWQDVWVKACLMHAQTMFFSIVGMCFSLDWFWISSAFISIVWCWFQIIFYCTTL